MGRKITKKTDLWNLGVVAYILATYEFPFDEEVFKDSRIYSQAILEGQRYRDWGRQSLSP